MKKLTLIFTTVLFVTFGTTTIFAQSNPFSSLSMYPSGNSWIRDSMFFASVDFKDPNQIKYIDLYIDGKPAGRDTRPPFRWGKGTDLRRGPKVLKPGTHKLKAIIRTKDGKQTTKYSTFKVKGR